MGRYTATLHNLADAGSSKHGNWNQLLNYLEGHSVGDSSAKNPNFDSPLPPFTSPSPELERELLQLQGPRHEDSPLRIAVRTAPSTVIAGLCHLGPEAARIADSKGRLPLHWACRRPPDKDVERTLRILVSTYPEGLIHRDECGRTPLHWLFWYHAETRSVKLVELFCKPLHPQAFIGLKQPPQLEATEYPLPEIPTPDVAQQVPPCAVIVHDCKHGALPLHYAAACGASKEVVRALLQLYPRSKIMRDRQSRTALHWYLGAGELRATPIHVCGESPDPNATPIYETPKSATVVQLLLNSKVSRTADDMGRYPLHWACCLLARYYYSGMSEVPCLQLRAIKLLLDTHVEALVSQDLSGQTPLHVMFQAVAEQQERDWTRLVLNKSGRDDVDMIRGGGPGSFKPPIQLVELLLQSPDTDEDMPHAEKTACAAHVEDESGWLPLHGALLTATSGEIVQMLIQSHPTSLIHATDQQLTPLHVALSHPYTTPLQPINTIMLLLQAYVTSRHGTYVNGRLALKMEDPSGNFPIHYACRNQACLEVLQLMLEKYPRASILQNENGDLPLHLLMEPSLFGNEKDERSLKVGASLAAPKSWISQAEEKFREEQLGVMQKKMSLTIEPLLKDGDNSLKIPSSSHGMLPLHVAVAFDALPYWMLYQLIDAYPDAAKHTATPDGKFLSVLDLHDLRRQTEDEDKWHMVRELVFCFAPIIDGHRQKEDLLDRCCRIVRDEAERKGSAHLNAMKEAEEEEHPHLDIDLEMTSFATESFDIPKISGGRPQRLNPRTPKLVDKKKQFSKSKKTKELIKPSPTATKKSVYDDDDNVQLGTYVASPNASYDDDSDYFSSEDDEEEDYVSDDSRYESDSQFDEDETVGEKDEDVVEEQGFEQTYQPSTDSTESGKNDKGGRPDASPIDPTLEEEIVDPNAPLELSDVAMRLWTFFNLYNMPGSPEDTYAEQVKTILDELDFKIVEKLVNMPVPEYGAEYLDVSSVTGITIRDAANVHCKAAIYQCYYFVGRYDFQPTSDAGILLHRSMDGDTIVVRATEHNIITEEAEDPDAAEAEIWATGAVAKPKSTFTVATSTVCFKFMKNQDAYERELQCRVDMGVPVEEEQGSAGAVMPLKNHFDLNQDKRRIDRRYRLDTNDERFKILFFQDDESAVVGQSITLQDYPYSIVCHFSEQGDLHDHFLHHGMLGMDEIRDVGAQVGRSLQAMHEKALVHTQVCMRNVVSLPSSDDGNAERHWALTNLSCACRRGSESFYVAEISGNGSAQFLTGVFPPEMFVKLIPDELESYNAYWSKVKDSYNVSVDREIIEPKIDSATGDCFVLRCHFRQEASLMGSELPYKLVPARETMDIWSFGLILFSLCSSGHPLFPTNPRTGNLLSYEQIATWDKDAAETAIYRHVDDPLAQDLLLYMLGTYEERATLHMETIMTHPFFTKAANTSNMVAALNRIMEQRSQESVARRRAEEQKVARRVEEQWLEKRSTTIHFWDLDVQLRMHLAPSELMRKVFGNPKRAPIIPYSFIVLPYRLTRSRKGKFTPGSKKDVERAERMGRHLLNLSKACHFACCMEQSLSVKRAEANNSSHKWSAQEIAEAIAMPSDDFNDLESEMIGLAAKEVELFRDNPMYVANKLIQKSIDQVLACFEESQKAFVYLVDEYHGVPIVADGDMTYPKEITEKISPVVRLSLPYMLMVILYVRGVAKSVTGLVKLIFEGAYPHIPPSWDFAAKGLPHELNQKTLVREIQVLHDAINDIYSTKKKKNTRNVGDLSYAEKFFKAFDAKRTHAGLKRVFNGDASIWTTDQGVKELKELASVSGFAEAYAAQKAIKKKIKDQEEEIAALKKRVEELEFRRNLNLTAVPDENGVSFDLLGIE